MSTMRTAKRASAKRAAAKRAAAKRSATLTATVAAAAIAAATAYADEEHRQLSAHEHGVSVLEIAVEGARLSLDLFAPGADIVGFEHEAKSDEDKDAVAAAIAQLKRADEVFVPSAAAGCRLLGVEAELLIDADDHDHDDHGHDDHGHDDHVHGDHDHGDHDHGDHDHGDHDHGDHDHGDHDEAAGGATHSEFEAGYDFECDNPDALTEIALPFFDVFENAREVDARIVTEAGATAVEVERDAPRVPLR